MAATTYCRLPWRAFKQLSRHREASHGDVWFHLRVGEQQRTCRARKRAALLARRVDVERERASSCLFVLVYVLARALGGTCPLLVGASAIAVVVGGQVHAYYASDGHGRRACTRTRAHWHVVKRMPKYP